MNERDVLMARIDRAVSELFDIASKLESGPATFRNIDGLRVTLERRANKKLEGRES